jgi:uncharacterized membrane protein YedE/YeeE
MPSTSTKPTCSVESRCPTWLPLGIGLGLTGTAAIGLWGPLGVSTTYPRLLGQTLSRFVPDFALQPYLAAIGIDGLAPETMVVLGMLIGGLLMARLSRRPAPAMEVINVGEHRPGNRLFHAFIGGFFLLFGARLAGGCTSGHVISGVSQLALSGFVFFAAVFATAMVVSALLKRPLAGR